MNTDDWDSGKLDETEARENALTDLLIEIEAYALDDEYSERADELWEEYVGNDDDGTLDKINDLIGEYEKKTADYIIEKSKEQGSDFSDRGGDSSLTKSKTTSSSNNVGRAGCIIPFLIAIAIPTIIFLMESDNEYVGLIVFAVLFVTVILFFIVISIKSREGIDPEHYTFTYGTVSECSQTFSVDKNGILGKTYKVKAQTEDGNTVTAYADRSIEIGKRLRLAVKKGTRKAQIIDDSDVAVSSADGTSTSESRASSSALERSVVRKRSFESEPVIESEDELIAKMESCGMNVFVNKYCDCVDDNWNVYHGIDDDDDLAELGNIKHMIALFERLYSYRQTAAEAAKTDSDSVFPEYDNVDTPEPETADAAIAEIAEKQRQEIAQELAQSLKRISDLKREVEADRVRSAVSPDKKRAPALRQKPEIAIPEHAPSSVRSSARKTASAPSALRFASQKPENGVESGETASAVNEPQPNVTEAPRHESAATDRSPKRVIGYKSIKKR